MVKYIFNRTFLSNMFFIIKLNTGKLFQLKAFMISGAKDMSCSNSVLVSVIPCLPGFIVPLDLSL